MEVSDSDTQLHSAITTETHAAFHRHSLASIDTRLRGVLVILTVVVSLLRKSKYLVVSAIFLSPALVGKAQDVNDGILRLYACGLHAFVI